MSVSVVMIVMVLPLRFLRRCTLCCSTLLTHPIFVCTVCIVDEFFLNQATVARVFKPPTVVFRIKTVWVITRRGAHLGTKISGIARNTQGMSSMPGFPFVRQGLIIHRRLAALVGRCVVPECAANFRERFTEKIARPTHTMRHRA